MKANYRKGGVGAMMDEYERAWGDLRRVVERISEKDFEKIVDPETQDESCHSVQTIMSHVVSAGYSYADSIRGEFSMTTSRPPRELFPAGETVGRMEAMLRYTEETLEGHWEMTDEEIMKTSMTVSWGPTYDVEQLLEHAIVHVLRHRRQIEKFGHNGSIHIDRG